MVSTFVPFLVGLCTVGEKHLFGPGHSDDVRRELALYSFYVESEDERILVDLGPKTLGYVNEMFRRFGVFREKAGSLAHPDDIVQPRGNLLEQLAARGIDPASVTAVVFTHLHADHHGVDDGSGPGMLADFPNAVVYVAKRGWEDNLARRGAQGRWSSYVDFAFSDYLMELTREGRVVFADEAEVAPGVRTFYLGGHTPCSQGVVVEYRGARAVLTSDELLDYKMLADGRAYRERVSAEAWEAAVGRLVAMARDGAVLLPAHEPSLIRFYDEAGEGWLGLAREATERAVGAYRAARGG